MNASDSEHFSLRWNNFHSNLSTGFHAMLEEVDLVDVTLAAEGQFVQAHKIVLSVCSPYFKQLFKVNPCKHPIVILKDVSHKELVAILQFMYQGEVNVRQEELAAFLKTAEMLQIKGLTGSDSPPSESPPPLPITQPVSRLREPVVDTLRALEETPQQRTFKRKRVDPPVTSLISSNTTTTTTVSPAPPQILTDSSSSFDLPEMKKPKDEPVDYESDIEELECKVISTDNSIAQLLQGETSQPLQESSQTSLNMFSSLAGLSQDSGGSQEGGQGDLCRNLDSFLLSSVVAVEADSLQQQQNHHQSSYQCDRCDKAFSRRDCLSRHVSNIHGRLQGPYSCVLCGKTLKNKLSLNTHMYNTHNISFNKLQATNCVYP